MAGKVGVLNVLAVDATPESSFGTAATTPDKAWIFRGGRPAINVETVDNKDAQIGVYGNGTQTVIVGKSMSAAPEYDANMDNLAFYLRAILGTIGTTGAGPYVHTITETQGNSPSFTYYWKGPDTTSGKMERFTGCKVATLALSFSAGGKVILRPSIIGSGTHTEETVSAPAFNTDSLLSHAQVSAFTVNGTDYFGKLKDFELTIDRQIDQGAERVVGSTTLPSLDSTGIAISGRFTVNDEENDLAGLAALAEAKTLVPIVLTLTLGTASAVITLRKVALDSPGEDGGKGKQTRAVAFTGFYSPSDTETMRAVVTNSTTAYS